MSKAEIIPEKRALYQPELPKKLQEANKKTSCQKCLSIVYLILSILIPIIGLLRILGYLIRKVSSRAVLPSQMQSVTPKIGVEKTEELLNKWTEVFPKIERVEFASSDGNALEGIFVEGDVNSDKVIIYFLQNAVSAQDVFSYPLQPYMETASLGVSRLYLNVRGVQGSQGSPSSDQQLALDAYSSYRYLMDEKNFKLQNILGVGDSLGGWYGALGAALVQSEYPTIPISFISRRSLVSPSITAQHLIFGLGLIARGIMSASGFGATSCKKAFDSLKGHRAIFYVEDDGLIKQKASLAYAYQKEEEERLKDLEKAALPSTMPTLISLEKGLGLSHIRPLREKEVERFLSEVKTALNIS